MNHDHDHIETAVYWLLCLAAVALGLGTLWLCVWLASGGRG